jgi:hypothetical protein
LNLKQEAIFNVINAIVGVKDVQQLMKLSEIRYGFLNYVAKYSLARDKYFITPQSLSHLESHGLLKELRLRRGLKSQKNGFTYEHPIPANVIGDQILLCQGNSAKIKEILEWSDWIFVLTTEENNKLASRLTHGMPLGWRFFEDNVLARYLEVGIITSSTSYSEIEVFGSVAR